MIKSVGAKVLNLSLYSPDFNPIELWWSQLKSFLRSFSPTTAKMVDRIISVATPVNESSTFKKTGLLSAATVPHNNGKRCIKLITYNPEWETIE
ncbi:MAG: hypothetical protein F6K18_03740 [Okeania sp. SIO2C2]|nr:hypothetical protein [Okeania sp. SIO2C2]